MGVPWENITRQPIEVPRFGGGYTYTMDFVNLDLKVRTIQAAHQFYVIEV